MTKETELADIRVEYARARGEFAVLEGEMYRELTYARADLRNRGDYVEYSPGESYVTVPDMLTAAESLPGGVVRMCYLDPGEFPELYEARRKRDEKADEAVRWFLDRLGAKW